MPQQSFARLTYETPEKAASMAAMINNSQHECAVKAIAEGRSLAIVPVNPSLASFFHVWSRLQDWLLKLTRKVSSSRKTTANA